MIHPSWKPILDEQFNQPYFKDLSTFLTDAYATKTIFPRKTQVFSAFTTDLNSVKVVILGQDPYHTPGAAHGLAFSVQNSIIPPSLQNIYKEIDSDLGQPPNSDSPITSVLNSREKSPAGGIFPGEESREGVGNWNSSPNRNGDLTHWAQQGVLLLNTVLTVEARKAASHRGRGWEQFTDEIISKVNKLSPHLVFILWGRDARSKKALIDTSRHAVLESPHPSPLSAHSGFFGSKPFSQTNAQLAAWGYPEIKW